MKLGKAFLGAVVLMSGTFAVFACGGSSTSSSTTSSGNDAGGSGNSQTGSDSGSTVQTGDAATCTGATGDCASGEVCCQPIALSGATCVASGSCTGVTLSAACKGSSDCSSGEFCCVSFSGGISSACSATACTGAQLCSSPSDCPTGDTCQTVAGYSACVPSAGDGGFSFDASGFGFDAGTPVQDDDSGIADAGPG